MIVEAAVRRFRPIILTAAAAVLAMIPLSRSVFRGADGGGHHGRADRRHGADAAGAAGDVRGSVLSQTGAVGIKLKSPATRKNLVLEDFKHEDFTVEEWRTAGAPFC